jgi:saccharopine dehydrogenase-like NADP-dependent oxidoreductase
MMNLLILGSGKIGSLLSFLLADSGDYNIYLADIDLSASDLLNEPNITFLQLDAEDEQALDSFFDSHSIDGVISALPYYCNPLIARMARKYSIHYFDLTEDVSVTEQVIEISKGAQEVFIPQSGLAPGFISIVTQHLIKNFDELDIVKMRVGALPVRPSNALKYSLTWSTDGVINEYGNTCYGIKNGEMVPLQPLEGHETIEIDGLQYEAFNTSGGLGTLAETYLGKVDTMTYKTVRYPGHCEKMKFLMNDLKLNQDRKSLKRILENSIPKTLQDVVLIYVSVSGKVKGELYEETYFKKIYPQKFGGTLWSAIQVTTASGICAVVDITLKNKERFHGFVKQEDFELNEFLENRFGRIFK